MTVRCRCTSSSAREEMVDIAGDKFGTHVLCKAIAIKELEVNCILPGR